MRANHHSTKSQLTDIGGASTRQSPLLLAAPGSASASVVSIETRHENDEESYDAALADLYDPPILISSPKKHNLKALKQRLKAKHLTGDRLVRLSTELSKLADEIRYLDPVIAEILDEAWDATEEAIELLEG